MGERAEALRTNSAQMTWYAALAVAITFTDGATRVWLIGDKAYPYGPGARLLQQRGFRRDKGMHLIAGHARLSLFVR